jgi:hypothetical protein
MKLGENPVTVALIAALDATTKYLENRFKQSRSLAPMFSKGPELCRRAGSRTASPRFFWSR